MRRENGVPEVSAQTNLETHYTRGSAYINLGKCEMTTSIMEKALSQWESKVKKDCWTVSYMKHKVAYAYHMLRQEAQALEWAWKALAASTEMHGPTAVITHDIEDLIGDIYISLKNSEGLEWLQGLHLKREKTLGVNQFRTETTKRHIDTFHDHYSSDEYSNDGYSGDEYTDRESSWRLSGASSLIGPEEISIDFEYPEVLLPT